MLLARPTGQQQCQHLDLAWHQLGPCPPLAGPLLHVSPAAPGRAEASAAWMAAQAGLPAAVPGSRRRVALKCAAAGPLPAPAAVTVMRSMLGLARLTVLVLVLVLVATAHRSGGAAGLQAAAAAAAMGMTTSTGSCRQAGAAPCSPPAARPHSSGPPHRLQRGCQQQVLQQPRQ
jgi:hypothetical protein